MATGERIVGITSLASTNRTITVTTGEMGLSGGRSYVAWDPFNKTAYARFKDSFTYTIGPRCLVLFRILTEPRFEKVTVPWSGNWFYGTGTSLNAGTAQGPSPFFFSDGLTQSAANQVAAIKITMPGWARQVTFIAAYYSAYAGTVAWTNHPYLDYYHPTGRVQRDASNDPNNVPETTVVCTSGTWTWHTNVIRVHVDTNAPKSIYFQLNASSNASARYIMGSPTLIYE
jgi:hypothetical protein